MIQKTVDVTENKRISGDCWKMRLASPEIAAEARPGQFVMVRPDNGLKPFLPRPFSIHRVNTEAGGLELLYKVVGQGTAKMSALAAGDPMAVIGPLGKGFLLDQPFENIDIVAGGIGVAPLVFLAAVLIDGRSVSPDRIRAFIGGAGADDVLCRQDFAAMKIDAWTATDNGSLGYHGFVTEPFQNAINDRRPDMIFACGPPAMLRTVARISIAENIACQVSVESMMACGIGACLGCAIKANNSIDYKHVCREGPVFSAGDLDFDDLVDTLGARHQTN
jgi:dihydroorotate dehydrogenase electron transfer subunit